MAKTKAQKVKAVEEGLKDLKSSETVVLADFTGLPVNQMNVLRRSLRVAGATFKVLKKRLLKIIFEGSGIVFDPKKFEGQTGVVFSGKDMVETSGLVYKFAKGKELFKILGGFDIKEKKFIEAADVKRYGALPGR
ncbi:MAG: 50S ribosomal protein L10, partial [Patescibacteria group bacterium]